MLAYVFWHWPQPGAERTTYEHRLAEFHKAVRASSPPGFRASAVFRLQGAPWVPADSGYEDWYVLDGSAALDPLNDAAISGARKLPHDAAAQLAAGGTAGLYRLRAGEEALGRARFSHWFAKPAGMRYDDLYARLRTVSDRPGVALWGRQMTLGPTPEFCLQAPERVQLPAGFSALSIELGKIVG